MADEKRRSDDDPGRPFSAAENEALRKMLEQDARVRWFWETARVWAAWVTGIVAAMVIFRDWLKAGLKLFMGPP